MAAFNPDTIATYAVQYIGNPATDAARLATLTHAGPLLLATEHLLVGMAPDAFDRTTNAPHVTVKTTQLLGMTFGGVLFDATVAAHGMHLTVIKTRWAKLFADIDADGKIDKTPIPGDARTAIPKLTRRLVAAIKLLPAAQRTITNAEVVYDGDPDDPNTDDWYDWMTPSLLVGGAAGPEIVAQWMSLTPGCYVERATTRKAFYVSWRPYSLPLARILMACPDSR